MARTPKAHALVVGGTRGIGRAITKELLATGFIVSVIGRSAPRSGWPKSVRVWQADLGQTTSLPGLFEEILRVNGPLHSLVFLQRFRGSGDPWDPEINVSLTATRTLIDLAQSRFSTKHANSIVLVGSIAGHMVAEEQPLSYHVAKGALRQLARYYACALGPKGIRVNCISPGVILKPEAEEFYRLNRKVADLYRRIAPLRRFGTAAEVATVVRFLCSPDSNFVTGQDIIVDGGISLVWQASLARSLCPVPIKQLSGTARARRKRARNLS